MIGRGRELIDMMGGKKEGGYIVQETTYRETRSEALEMYSSCSPIM